jgi:hypothetical protein
MSLDSNEDTASYSFSSNDATESRVKCETCGKEFRTQWELSSHKEVEHVRHLAVAGIS